MPDVRLPVRVEAACQHGLIIILVCIPPAASRVSRVSASRAWRLQARGAPNSRRARTRMQVLPHLFTRMERTRVTTPKRLSLNRWEVGGAEFCVAESVPNSQLPMLGCRRDDDINIKQTHSHSLRFRFRVAAQHPATRCTRRVVVLAHAPDD